MSDAALSEEAFEQYFGSRGTQADIALKEDHRPLHSERVDPTRTHTVEDGYTPAEAEYFRTGDAAAARREEYERSPQAREQERRESWADYEALQDELKATKQERD